MEQLFAHRSGDVFMDHCFKVGIWFVFSRILEEFAPVNGLMVSWSHGLYRGLVSRSFDADTVSQEATDRMISVQHGKTIKA